MKKTGEKIIGGLLLSVLLFLLCPGLVYAAGGKADGKEGVQEATFINGQGDGLTSVNSGYEEKDAGIWGKSGLSEVADQISSLMPEYSFDMEAVFGKIIKGEIWEALKLVGGGIKEKLLTEIAGMKNLFAAILMLGVMSAIFANFSDIFKNHQISEISFYFLYLFLMSVLMKSFLTASQIAGETVESITTFIKLFIPTYCMALGASTGITTAAVYYQFMILLVFAVQKLILSVLIPFIYSYVILALLNGIWAEERLSLILELIKKGVDLGLKLSIGAITGISFFQTMITPVIDSLKTSAVKKAISVIPGIGNLAEGVTEMVVGSAILIKNSIGVLMLLLLLFLCLMPLCKLFLIAVVLKGSAALSGIVSDKRITGCTDRVADAGIMLLKAVLTAVVLFIITIAIVAYSTGKMM